MFVTMSKDMYDTTKRLKNAQKYFNELNNISNDDHVEKIGKIYSGNCFKNKDNTINPKRVTFIGHATRENYGLGCKNMKNGYMYQEFAELLIKILPTSVEKIDLIGCEMGLIVDGDESYAQKLANHLEGLKKHLIINTFRSDVLNIGKPVSKMEISFSHDFYPEIGIHCYDENQTEQRKQLKEKIRAKSEFLTKTEQNKKINLNLLDDLLGKDENFGDTFELLTELINLQNDLDKQKRLGTSASENAIQFLNEQIKKQSNFLDEQINKHDEAIHAKIKKLIIEIIQLEIIIADIKYKLVKLEEELNQLRDNNAVLRLGKKESDAVHMPPDLRGELDKNKYQVIPFSNTVSKPDFNFSIYTEHNHDNQIESKPAEFVSENLDELSNFSDSSLLLPNNFDLNEFLTNEEVDLEVTSTNEDEFILDEYLEPEQQPFIDPNNILNETDNTKKFKYSLSELKTSLIKVNEDDTVDSQKKLD